jgi:hypothetical protein
MDWSSWTDWLALIGGVLQCFGLWLTVVEIVRTENRTFPERKDRARRAIVRLRAWWPPWRKDATVHARSAWISATGGGATATGGQADVTVVPADPLARIDALEKRVAKLHAEQQAAVDALRKRMTESDELLGQRIANLANDIYRARDEDKAALDESLARQKGYTAMFVAGTVLATFASVYG